MARKKKAEPESAGGGWISTFADLMNLLLCFFVLLFSMSTVDADKYEAIVTSLSESIDIFSGGGSTVGEGAFVSDGTTFKIKLEQYFDEFDKSGNEEETKTDASVTGKNKEEGKDEYNPNHNQNIDDNDRPGDKNKTDENQQAAADKTDLEKLKDEELAKLKKKTEEMYEEVAEKAGDKKIEDMINVNMDEKFQYVQISLSGAVLFDSGDDQIKKSAIPILSKVGDILRIYGDKRIRIEGHTDNVPISSGRFKNNMWLSTARATNVFEYFVDKKGLSPKKLEATGRSQYDRVASNKTAEGRAKNRRVEIKIYTED
ncbi:OmpA/MotB family protein [Eubacterium xylanophilum]|uniref:OmpA/MotB family protein n=1 Tax=Eubacterium xylanophilum TaxID=39497 RepID=UPI00047D3F81|nr:flagellar motor protein MotB [Eubacterium xylanophilum]